MNFRVFGTVLNAGAFIALVVAAASTRLDRSTAHWLIKRVVFRNDPRSGVLPGREGLQMKDLTLSQVVRISLCSGCSKPHKHEKTTFQFRFRSKKRSHRASVPVLIGFATDRHRIRSGLKTTAEIFCPPDPVVCHWTVSKPKACRLRVNARLMPEADTPGATQQIPRVGCPLDPARPVNLSLGFGEKGERGLWGWMVRALGQRSNCLC